MSTTKNTTETQIFVYGSLLPGHDDYYMIDLKTKQGADVDTILYGYSLYWNEDGAPFITESEEKGAYVFGEVVTLKTSEAQKVLNALDKNYTDYERTTVYANDRNGGVYEADAFIATDSMAKKYLNDDFSLIPSGDWDEFYGMMIEDMEAAEGYTNIYDDLDDMEDEQETNTTVGNVVSNSYAVPHSQNKVATGKTAKPSSAGLVTKSPYFMERSNAQSDYVWYIAYGSNLSSDRFLKYMNIGRYKDVFTVNDLESVQVQIPHGIYFAKSGKWGSGGIAFLDIDTNEEVKSTFRAYRLTKEQYWSLLCQENGRTKFKLDWKKIRNQRINTTFGSGLYSRVVNMGTINGELAITMTHDESFVDQIGKMKETMPWQFASMGMLNPPSHAYLNVINLGADETTELPSAELKPYVPKKVTTSERKTNTQNTRTATKVTNVTQPAFSHSGK